MSQHRLVGIDLGIASAHTVRVQREDGSEVCRRRCWPRLDRKQGGKAPHQVHQGHATRARSALTSRPSPEPILTSDLTPIKQVLMGLQERINVPS